MPYAREFMGDAFSYEDFNERLVGAGTPRFFAIREFMPGEVTKDD